MSSKKVWGVLNIVYGIPTRQEEEFVGCRLVVILCIKKKKFPNDGTVVGA
jgi:hypothetical protein